MGHCAASDLHLVTFGNFRRIDARLPLVHWHMVFEHLAWLNLNHQVVFIQRSAFQCTVRYPIRPYPGLSGHFFFVLERQWEGDTGDVLEEGAQLPIWRTRSVDTDAIRAAGPL